MERNEYGQYEFPQIIYRNKCYIDFSTLVEISGEKRSTLARKLSKLNNVEFIQYKNRRFYLLTWAFKLHQHYKDQNV